MSFISDVVEVGSDKPEPICTVGPTGALLQIRGGAAVWLGGPDVQPGKGLLLSEGDAPLPVPGGYSSPINLGDPPDPLQLYGIANEGATARVAYLKHNLPAS